MRAYSEGKFYQSNSELEIGDVIPDSNIVLINPSFIAEPLYEGVAKIFSEKDLFAEVLISETVCFEIPRSGSWPWSILMSKRPGQSPRYSAFGARDGSHQVGGASWRFFIDRSGGQGIYTRGEEKLEVIKTPESFLFTGRYTSPTEEHANLKCFVNDDKNWSTLVPF